MYDLSVEGAHEFFANGVLVSNSTDTLVYSRKLVAGLFESGAVTQETAPAATSTYVDPQGLDPVHLEQHDMSNPYDTGDNFSDPWGG